MTEPTPAQVLEQLEWSIEHGNRGHKTLKALQDAAALIRQQAEALVERGAECERLRGASHNNFSRTFLATDDYAALLKVYVFANQSQGNSAARIMAFTGLSEQQLLQLDALVYAFEEREGATQEATP